jgi:hypothetical protein
MGKRKHNLEKLIDEALAPAVLPQDPVEADLVLRRERPLEYTGRSPRVKPRKRFYYVNYGGHDAWRFTASQYRAFLLACIENTSSGGRSTDPDGYGKHIKRTAKDFRVLNVIDFGEDDWRSALWSLDRLG